MGRARIHKHHTGELTLDRALAFLEHYHREHSGGGVITRFKNTKPPIAIYITDDPEWIERFREFTKSEFPQQEKERGSQT